MTAMKKTNDEIRNEFAHHAPRDNDVVAAHDRVRMLLSDAAVELNEMLPDGRHKEKALDAVEMARLYANTAIALG